MKREFKLMIVARDSTKQYIDGEQPGVIASQILTYDLTEEQYASPAFASSLIRAQDDFMEQCFMTTIEEVNP